MPRHKQPVSPAVRAKLSRAVREEGRALARRESTLAQLRRAGSLTGRYTFGLPTLPEPLPRGVHVLESTAYAAALSGPSLDWRSFDRLYLGLHLVPRRAS